MEKAEEKQKEHSKQLGKSENAPDKIPILLSLTVLFGFILRVINANTRILYGDPPHFLTHSINFLKSGLLVVYDQSTFLWYVFTDLSFKIFGLSQFASRFLAVFLGTMTILAIYLFAREFFNSRKIGLISAMIYAFAPVFIFNADDQQDIAVLFFIVMIFYCLIKGLNENSKKYLILSGIIFGVGCMWKAYLPILIIPYAGIVLYYNKTKRFDLKKNYKTFIYVLLIIFMLVTPTLVYNALNYKHNEVTDLLFAKFFNVINSKTEALYGWSGGGELYRSFEFKSPLGYAAHFKEMLYDQAPLLVVFGLASLFFLFIRRREQKAKDYLIFYLLYLIIPIIFLMGTISLSKHYIQYIAFIIPAIAYFIIEIYGSLRKKFDYLSLIPKHQYLSFALLIIILFFSILSFSYMGNNELLFSKNPENSLLSYKNSEIPDKSLIIYDDRVYNAFAGWLFSDKYYIPASFAGDFMKYNQQSNQKENVPIFFVECAVEDCGWGNIWKNQGLNKSMESFFENVKNQSIKEVFSSKEKITSLDYYNPLISSEPKRSDYYVVYKTYLPIDLRIAAEVKKQYSYFLYPINYENKDQAVFKNFVYYPEGFFESSLNGFAWLIFYLDIILSIAIFLLVPYELLLNQKIYS